MNSIILIFVALTLAYIGPQFIYSSDPKKASLIRDSRRIVRYGGLFVALLAVASTSFVFIGADETGHKHKIYLGGGLTEGNIIAAKGERGPQAEIIPPGFHLEPFLNILNEVTLKKVVDIPFRETRLNAAVTRRLRFP